ncbi:MAG: hypothetical protein QOK43_930 [Acidimicrobiaceae bacterium]|nr:hypothetical protein [Acidimicrobiaceae bacterium]
MVLDHADAEEREVCPLLHAHLAADELAPESATGNVILGPAVALFDRVRDATR